MNRDTLSTIATVIVAVVALGAFVRDELGDVRDEIRDVRDDLAEMRADIADLRERMVRVEVTLGVPGATTSETLAGQGDGASQ